MKQIAIVIMTSYYNINAIAACSEIHTTLF